MGRTWGSQGAGAGLRLELVEGPGAGGVVPLDGPMLIGRAPHADLTLSDARVCPEHARITVAGGGSGAAGVIVEDLRSSNGTFVNGQRVDGPTWILPGDELLIGVTIMRLHGAPADRAAGFDPSSGAYHLPGGRRGSAPDLHSSDRRAGPRELLRLLDVNVKRRAHSAPPVLLALICAIVTVYLMIH
jgi:FHA domain